MRNVVPPAMTPTSKPYRQCTTPSKTWPETPIPNSITKYKSRKTRLWTLSTEGTSPPKLDIMSTIMSTRRKYDYL